MFVIETCGKKILYTGDFRDHGIPGEETFEKMIRAHVGKVDILVTEGTMVSRIAEEQSNPVRTEEDLGKKAAEIFSSHRENVVLVSSTNLDSVMEFYHATPEDSVFLCDVYQAEIMKTAIEAKNRYYPRVYSYAKNIYILGGNAAISDDCANKLKTTGYTVNRISGATRYETAAAIASKLEEIVCNADVLLLHTQHFSEGVSQFPLHVVARFLHLVD